MPALSKAREKARSISCVNNLKQMQLGNLLYANDADDFLPPIHYRHGEDSGTNPYTPGGDNVTMADTYYWFSLNPLVPGNPMDGASWYAKDKASKRNNDGSTDGENKSSWHKMLSCPSAANSDIVMGNISYQSSVGMCHSKTLKSTTWMHQSNDTNGTQASTWHRVSSIKYTSLHINYLDGTQLTVFSNNGWVTSIATVARYPTDQANAGNLSYFRHGLNMNMSMTDGHVESAPLAKAKTRNSSVSPSDFFLCTDYYWYPDVNMPGGEIR